MQWFVIFPLFRTLGLGLLVMLLSLAALAGAIEGRDPLLWLGAIPSIVVIGWAMYRIGKLGWRLICWMIPEERT
jgi:hypothetical protein